VGRGAARFCSLPSRAAAYSIFNRSIEQEVLPICKKYGMGALVWSPLVKGMLTGRYQRACALRFFSNRCPTREI
jgi:aryl-alcohol dehydrogenase-like predicted oxidoreductase